MDRIINIDTLLKDTFLNKKITFKAESCDIETGICTDIELVPSGILVSIDTSEGSLPLIIKNDEVIKITIHE